MTWDSGGSPVAVAITWFWPHAFIIKEDANKREMAYLLSKKQIGFDLMITVIMMTEQKWVFENR